MDRTTHVVIVGAGVIGCSTAYELAGRGAKVQVIDRRAVGQGATQASAGVLAPLIGAHGNRELVDLGLRSLKLFDEFVARVIKDSGSAVQYVRSGTLEVAMNSNALGQLQALSRTCGARGVSAEYLDAKSVHEVEPQLSEKIRGGLLVETHGFVGAIDLTSALRRAAGAHGATFVTTSTAVRIVATNGSLRVETAGELIECDAIVLAAGSWSGQIEVEGEAPLPIRPVRGQLLRLGWPAAPLKRVVWSEQCYLVPWSDGSVLSGATLEEVGFDERATMAGMRQLFDATTKLMPQAREAWFQDVRVGLRPGTPDDIPVIGPSPRLFGLVYATGHFRSGILLAPLTASLVCDLILDQKHDPVFEQTSPARFGN